MVQIRSADEPMTAFFKVGVIVVQFYQMRADVYDVILVRYMRSQMEGELSVNDLEYGEEGFLMVITMVSRRNDFPDKSFFLIDISINKQCTVRNCETFLAFSFL